jgi:ABC-type multidrug transport system fused ATPase/permease subunit
MSGSVTSTSGTPCDCIMLIKKNAVREATLPALWITHLHYSLPDHMMEFITRFRANAKRASIVQSRIKAVEKMDAEAPELVEVDSVWRFAIPNSEPVGPPIIAVNDVSFDYAPTGDDGVPKSEDSMLLQKVNFGVDLTSRIAILGANGQGKFAISYGVPFLTYQFQAKRRC